MGSQKAAVWGWRTGPWVEFLQEHGVTAEVLKSEEGKIPVEQFQQYGIVILGQGRPERWSKEEQAQVREYLNNGGVLLVNTIAISGVAGSDFHASGAAAWIGADRYTYGSIPAEVLEKDNPLVSHLGDRKYDWYSGTPGIGGRGTGRVLVGLDGNARIWVNPVGQGGLIFISPEVMTLYKGEKNEDTEALLKVVEKAVYAALQDREILKTILGEPLKGAQAKVADKLYNLSIASSEADLSAARILAKYLQESLGKPVAIAGGKVRGGEEDLVIHVGSTEYVQEQDLDMENLHPYGYYIRQTDPNNLVLSGKNKEANAYAVYDFMKKIVGYRYFMPGPLGEFVPRHEQVLIPDHLNLKEEPDVLSYTNAGLYGGNGNFSRSWRTTLYATHALNRVVPLEKYGESHPEYYGMYNGERYIPWDTPGGTWQPCVSHPDLPGLAIEYAKEYFEKNPEALGFPLGVNDGGGDCQCPDCTQAKQQYGNQYVPFYNEVARLAKEEFPGKYVAFIAYGGASNAPRGITLEDNILVEITGMGVSAYDRIKEWRKAGTANFGIYDYLYGNGYVVPRHYPNVMAEAWRDTRDNYGLLSLWTESFIRVWVYDGPRQYVLNELAWDLDADVEALQKDYFNLFYGPAAEPMKALFDRIEDIYQRDGRNPLNPMGDRDHPRQFIGYEWEDLDYIRERLDESRSLVVEESDYAKRLDLFEAIWGLSDAFVRSWLVAQEVEGFQKEDSDWVETLEYGFEQVRKIEAYTIDPEMEKQLFTRDMTTTQYKQSRRNNLRTYLELAIDRWIQEVDKELLDSGGEQAVVEYWQKQLGLVSDEELENILLSRVAEYLFPESRRDLFAQKQSMFSDEEIKIHEWQKASHHFPGWSTWVFPRSVSEFEAVPDDKATNGYAMGIRRNDIGASFLRGFRCQPGDRYRIRLSVKQTEGLEGGSVSVRWRKPDGSWFPTVGDVIVPSPKANGEWQDMEFSFTVPEGAGSGLILLGGSRQSQEGGIWFKNVSLYKTFSLRNKGEWFQVSEAQKKTKNSTDIVIMKPFDMNRTYTLHSEFSEKNQVNHALQRMEEWLGLERSESGTGTAEDWKVSLLKDEQVPASGYRLEIRAADGSVEIHAADAEGARCGISAFMERLGVRWFNPAAEPHIPEGPVLLANYTESGNPSFSYRGLHITGRPNHMDERLVEWMSFQKMNRKLAHVGSLPHVSEDLEKNGIAPDTTVHSYSDWIPNNLFEENPEFFSLVGGKRITHRDGGQLCVSNFEMREKFVENMRLFLDNNPDIAVIGICPNDGYGWCECEECAKLDTEGDRENDTVNGRVADFVEWVCDKIAQSHPQVQVGNYSYSNFSDFQKYLKNVPENLLVSVTTFRDYRHTLSDPSPSNTRNQAHWERLNNIVEEVPSVYVYDYIYHRWSGLPQPIWHVFQQDFQDFHRIGVSGYMTEISGTESPTHRNTHLIGYVQAKLLYDKDTPLDELLMDYCVTRFGPAALPMRDYLDIQEQAVRDMEGILVRGANDLERLITVEVESKLREALQRAEHLAEGTEYAEAIASEKEIFAGWAELVGAQRGRVNLTEVEALPFSQFGPDAEIGEGSYEFVDNTLKIAKNTHKTLARVYADDTWIGVIIDCYEPNMEGVKSKEGNDTGAVYGSDNVEIFLKHGQRDEICYHMLISVSGGHSASECEGTNWNWSWEGHYETEVIQMEDRWRVLFKIPRTSVFAEEDFYFTLIRNRRTEGWEISGVPDGGAFFDTSRYLRATSAVIPTQTP